MPNRIDDPIERAMRRAYLNHRCRSIGRGIAFEFTFEEWRQWWLAGNRWAYRGRGQLQFVMARRGDSGPYSPANVYCTTQRGNALDIPREKLSAAARKWWADHPDRVSHLKGSRGAKHPRSRPIKTPAGMFESAALAAEAFEITRQYAALMAREKREGWEYV